MSSYLISVVCLYEFCNIGMARRYNKDYRPQVHLSGIIGVLIRLLLCATWYIFFTVHRLFTIDKGNMVEIKLEEGGYAYEFFRINKQINRY